MSSVPFGTVIAVVAHPQAPHQSRYCTGRRFDADSPVRLTLAENPKPPTVVKVEPGKFPRAPIPSSEISRAELAELQRDRFLEVRGV
jgi:hypothetical protein